MEIHTVEKSSSVTGLVAMEPVEITTPDHDEQNHDAPGDGHQNKKMKGTRDSGKQVLIGNPPVLASQPAVEGPLTADVDAQRALKKKMKQEAENKKEEAEMKKREASQKAIEKAQAKLNIALAKAKVLEEKPTKNKRLKRRLGAEFDAAADNSGAAPSASSDHSMKANPPSSPCPKPRAPKKPKSVKLSPKAKTFAAKATSPNKKTMNASMEKALAALQTLRDLHLDDLPLPDGPSSKKFLACM
jgi:hypothetical protein